MYTTIERCLAVVAALSYTTSAMSISMADTEDSASAEVNVAAPEAAQTTSTDATNPAADSEGTDGTAVPLTGLAQVNQTFSIDKMPNAEVIPYLKSLRADKWNQLAVNPPLDMTADNVSITATPASYRGGSGEEHDITNLINDSEEPANKTVHDGSEFAIDFNFKDDVPRRVSGFVIKSAIGQPERDPEEVTVSWDLEINKPTKSITFPLDFAGKSLHEIYNDLPDLDVADLKFSFKRAGAQTMQIAQIEIFGPTAEAIQTGKDELAAGEYSTEEWWVYTAASDTEAEECVRAARTTTASGWYLDSSVTDVPTSECCLQGNTLNQAQLKLACPGPPVLGKLIRGENVTDMDYFCYPDMTKKKTEATWSLIDGTSTGFNAGNCHQHTGLYLDKEYLLQGTFSFTAPQDLANAPNLVSVFYADPGETYAAGVHANFDTNFTEPGQVLTFEAPSSRVVDMLTVRLHLPGGTPELADFQLI